MKRSRSGQCGSAGVELQMPREQRGRGIGHAHRHAGVAAVRGLDRIHREGADGIGEAAVGRLHEAPSRVRHRRRIGRAD